MKSSIKLLVLTSAIAIWPWPVLAQPGAIPQRDQARLQQQADDDGGGQPIFGRQLMTSEEIAAHRTRMREATSAEERARIRAEHHAQMVERARERGITLPGEPPQHGMGAGRGPDQRPDDRPRKGSGPGGG